MTEKLKAMLQAMDLTSSEKIDEAKRQAMKFGYTVGQINKMIFTATGINPFENKKKDMTIEEKKNIFREILSRYNSGDILNAKDFTTALELFKNHYGWRIKEGVGVKEIGVLTDPWSKKGYMLKRIDGTETDISFIVAARGYGDSPMKKIANACRAAIVPTILEFKDKINFGIDKCPITGEILTKENVNIDHYDMTFEELFKSWMKNKSIEQLAILLNDSAKDMVMDNYFTDKDIINDFVNYHNKNTHLRGVTKEANQSILRGKEGPNDSNKA